MKDKYKEETKLYKNTKRNSIEKNSPEICKKGEKEIIKLEENSTKARCKKIANNYIANKKNYYK